MTHLIVVLVNCFTQLWLLYEFKCKLFTIICYVIDMVFTIPLWNIYLLAIVHSVVSSGQEQCPKPQNECRIRTSTERNLDYCSSIVSMLAGIDKANKGLQAETRKQLNELVNKITNILHKIDPCSSNPCVNGKCSKVDDSFKCTCNVGFKGRKCADTVTATDCYDLKHEYEESRSGVHIVKPWRSKTELKVFCDMNTDGGGWTVFQNRFNGSVTFYRNFEDYKQGFGDMHGEFWLGLDHIEEITSQGPTELRLHLTAADGSVWSETYSDFRLSPYPDFYIHLSSGVNASGSAKFRMMLYNGYAFTTWDHDSDLDTQKDLVIGEDLNCGTVDHGGWWYGFCTANHFVNLNGDYCTPGNVSTYNDGYGGMMYRDFKGLECLKSSRIMIRRTMTVT